MYIISNAGGTIPSQLCNHSLVALSIDVSNTNIHCYSGCLTSANITIHGASSFCPNGSIMKQFIIISISCLFILLLGTISYKNNNSMTNNGCSTYCVYCNEIISKYVYDTR